MTQPATRHRPPDPGGLGALDEPTTPVRVGFIASYTVASFAQWLAILVPLQLLLPRQLALIDEPNKITNFAVVASVSALVGLVCGPLFGALSDRTAARFGRRHPWRVLGAGWAAVTFVALGHATTVTGVLLLVVLNALGGAALGASFYAAIPDRVPGRQRGRISAYTEIAQRAALVCGVAVASVVSVAAGYTMIAVALVVSTAVFVLVTPDARLARSAVPRWNWRGFLAEFWVSPRRHPDFAWALLTRMSFVLATAFATGFLLFLLQDAVGYEQVFPGSTAEGGVTILIAVFTAMAVPVAYGVGAWSDRLGRRKPFVVAGSVVFALGCLMLTQSQTWASVLGAAVLMGAGIGCFAAVDAPINAGVLPAAAHRARHLAVATLAAVLPQIVAPALGAPIIAFLGGYPTLYAVAAGSALLAALLVQPIKGLR